MAAAAAAAAAASDNSHHYSLLPRNFIRIKLLSLGNSTVGKSCLIKRYCEKKFVNKYISTIGVDFGVRTVPVVENKKSIELKVNFW
jgi:DnaJ family protein C protein 27